MDIQHENTTTKKPFYKKWWFFVIVGVVLISVICGLYEDYNNPSGESNIVATDNAERTESSQATEGTKQESKLTFELVAGVQGEYGRMITYNKGTEFEESFYAFYVPAGTYVVTNTGKYRSQLNVYSDEIVKNSDGWEEPAETPFVKLVDVNDSTTVTIEEGQHIEIVEPSNFRFEQQ